MFRPQSSFLAAEDEIRQHDYWTHPFSYKQRMIGAGTGCPFKCSFCRMAGTPWTMVDPTTLAREYAFFDGTAVDTVVTDMFLNRRWMERFLFEMERLAPRLWIRTLSRADSLDRCLDLLPAAHAAGIRVISIGFESANARVLHAIHKVNNEVSRFERIIEAADKAGIFVQMNVIVGLPEDDHDSLAETYEVVKRLRHSVNVSAFRPQKDSESYQQVLDAGIENPYADDFASYRATHRQGRKEIFLPTKYLSKNEVGEWYARISALRSPRAAEVMSTDAVRRELGRELGRRPRLRGSQPSPGAV